MIAFLIELLLTIVIATIVCGLFTYLPVYLIYLFSLVIEKKADKKLSFSDSFVKKHYKFKENLRI